MKTLSPRPSGPRPHSAHAKPHGKTTRTPSPGKRRPADTEAAEATEAAAEPGEREERVPLHHLPTEDLRKELERRHVSLRRLIVRRGRLLRQLREVEAQITALGGDNALHGNAHVAAPPRRRRARNPVSLPDAIAGVVEVRATVTPAEAAKLVLEAGYRSTSKNFGMMVANALAKDARFKRIARGRYERIA